MFASLVSSVHPESTSSSTFPSLPSTVRRPSSSSTSWPGIQTRIPSHHLKAAREQHQQHRHRSSHFLASFGFPAGSRPRRFIVRLALLVTLIVTLAWFIATGEIKQAWGPALSSLSPTVKSSGYPVSRVLEAAATATAIERANDVYRIHKRQAHAAAAQAHLAASSPPSILSPSQELVSLTHFLLSAQYGSLPMPSASSSDSNGRAAIATAIAPSSPSTSDSNIITGTTYDPSTEPLHAEWLLDFDYSDTEESRERMRQFEQEVWKGEGKLVVFGGSDVWSKEVVNVLRKDHRVMELAVVDFDARVDSQIVRPALTRLLPGHTFPLVVLGGTPIGSYAEIKALQADNKLGTMLAAHDVLVEPRPQRTRRSNKPVVRRR